jgi:hypothetical protein
MSEAGVHPRQLANGPVGECPRPDFGKSAAFKPCLLPGCDRFREIAAAVIGKAEIREQSDAPR